MHIKAAMALGVKALAFSILVAGITALASCTAQDVVAPTRVSAAVVADLPPVDLAHAGKQIEKAYYEADVPMLERFRLALRQQAEREPRAGKYVYYYLGFANFALADAFFNSDTDRFDQYIDAAERALKKSIAMAPQFAEAYALLGASYDIEIAKHHWKGMLLGFKAGHAIGEAFELAPSNPRVVLFKGFSDYGTPAAFGGDKKRGRQEYEASLQLFDRYQSSDPYGPPGARRWLTGGLRMSRGWRAISRKREDITRRR